MPLKKGPSGEDRSDQPMAEARRERERRLQTYRERALRIYPWVCGRCGREFSGKNLRLLTVHHRDHDHDNNPPDGSNWELLCVYCHDNEHSRHLDAEWYDGSTSRREEESPSTFRPFADIEDLLKDKK